jgi:hypothetical protein
MNAGISRQISAVTSHFFSSWEIWFHNKSHSTPSSDSNLIVQQKKKKILHITIMVILEGRGGKYLIGSKSMTRVNSSRYQLENQARSAISWRGHWVNRHSARRDMITKTLQ